MEITGRKMASIFTVPALIQNQGRGATLKTVNCCALEQYQVGITYKTLYQRIRDTCCIAFVVDVVVVVTIIIVSVVLKIR